MAASGARGPERDRLPYWKGQVRRAANLTRRDAEAQLQTAAAIPTRTKVNAYSLEEANQALLAFKRSRIDGTAVLVVS